MSAAMNPAAPDHLPVFITAPGEADVFLNGAAIFIVIMILALGSVYFRLHALPEHMAHRNASKLQFEVVAVLALLGLFTHNNLFWVAALLLALVPIPDFHGPLTTMADSLAKMAGVRWRTPSPPVPESAPPPPTQTSEIAAAQQPISSPAEKLMAPLPADNPHG